MLMTAGSGGTFFLAKINMEATLNLQSAFNWSSEANGSPQKNQNKSLKNKNQMDQPLKTSRTPRVLTLTQPFARLWKTAVDQLFEGYLRVDRLIDWLIDWLASHWQQLIRQRGCHKGGRQPWLVFLLHCQYLPQRAYAAAGTQRSGASFIKLRTEPSSEFMCKGELSGRNWMTYKHAAKMSRYVINHIPRKFILALMIVMAEVETASTR